MKWLRKPSIRQLLMTVIAHQERIMAGIDDLNNAVSALKDEVAANTTSTNNFIAVVESVLAALKTGGLTDAQAAAMAVKLQSGVTDLTAAQASLDAEAQKIQTP